MKINREVYIKSKSSSEERIIEIIKNFCDSSAFWKFLNEESERYSTDSMGEPACMISAAPQKTHAHAVLAIAKKKDNLLYISNIFPRDDKSQLTTEERDCIAYSFVSDFRKFVRKNKIPINTSSTDRIGIGDIISSSIARRLLDQYLRAFPKSYHPLDIERLDRFTCALARYSRKKPNFEYFERYLVEELSWSKSDAAWCRNRVEIGYTALGVNREFL